MMSRRGAAILIATAAVVFAPARAEAPRRAPSSAAVGRTGRRGTVGRRAASSAAAVEIDWYHIQNNDPGKSLWQTLADEYTAAHPNVKINLTVLENEAFKTKLTTLLQAGTPPDLFQSWGGGGLREQLKAGLVKDITADVASWASEINPGALGMYQVDGKQYGIPFDLGMVGFWYNKAQFAKAGITAPPATWDDFLADVQKLKAAGVTPIALAGKDTWTGAFYWAYLAVRECGKAGMDKAVTTGDWSDPCFVKAGEDFKQLIDLKPFQKGFLAAPWDGAGSGAAAMANGNGAIQLMGQWLPGHGHAPTPPTRRAWATTSAGSPSRPWPAAPVTPNDGLGGGNGFAVGKDAPPETDRLPPLPRQQGRRQPVGRPQHGHPADDRRDRVVGHRSAADVGPGRLAPRPTSSSSTSTRRPRRRWAGPSTRRSRPCTRAPARRSRSRRRSRRRQDPVVAANQRTSNGPAAAPARSVSSVHVTTMIGADPAGAPGAAPAAHGDRPVPAARAGPVRRLRPLPDRPGGPLQPLQVERPDAADRLRRTRQLPARAGRPGLPGRRPAQRPRSSSCRSSSRSRSRSGSP